MKVTKSDLLKPRRMTKTTGGYAELQPAPDTTDRNADRERERRPSVPLPARKRTHRPGTGRREQ